MHGRVTKIKGVTFPYFYSMFYLVKTPWWLKKMYPKLVWDMPAGDKTLYLTFDDGPHETATAFVLDQLKLYNAKATFFCIGKNVVNNAAVYKRILEEGHAAGNHTNDHLNGWKTNGDAYLQNILEAAKHIKSQLFRPPYGRITRFQSKVLQRDSQFKIIMWDVLSGDFDASISPEDCLKNVVNNAKPGSIIVFHDSAKAFNRLSYALPRVLGHFTKKGFLFKSLGTK